MYLLLFALVGSAFGLPTAINENVTITRNEEMELRYVLPTNTMPTFYDITLFLDPGNVTNFSGNVAISIIPLENTRDITMHAMEMDITSIRVTRDSTPDVDLFESFTLATDDTHLLRIRVNQDLITLVPYTVEIGYVGRHADNMFGVYISSYEYPGMGTINLVTSQLQPTFARRAFPCYDEPATKAIFRTTIYAPPAYPVVRSNMPERTDQLKPAVPGFNKFEFEDTLVMSTYLLAFLVSNFDYIDNTNDPLYHIPMKIYSRPGTQDFAEFALDFGQKNMDALEIYTEFEYAFPKMDKAAIPDFGAGAMENWGLVLYREVALLVQEGVTSTSVKQSIGRIICHENMHQWFGNEVSPLSWTYTWLNEGFANFFENFGTDLVLPEWRLMDQFVIALQNVFQQDAVLSVNPMTHRVYNPSEILGTFNAVAYQKSGSVIRMMQHALTPEVFRRGLVIYIKNNARKAAAPSDLYVAFQQAVDESDHTIGWPVATIMDRWANQGGFPVVTVRRTAPQSESIYVEQERYLTDRSLSSLDRWHIPINWVLSTNVDFSDTSPDAWVHAFNPTPHFDIPGLSQAEWFIVNKQQTGYYRVDYDRENWEALVKVMGSTHNIIHVLNRAQLIDDSFNLARNGRLDYSIPFDLSRYLAQETDYIPWASANAAFNYLDSVLGGSDVYELFQAYTLELMAPLYNQLGFEAMSTEEHVTAFHRNIILDHNCRQGNQDCLDRSQQLLQQFMNNPSQRLNPDIQTIVFCSGLRGGDAGNFNFLWQQYLDTSDSSEQSILLNALGCTGNPENRIFYLNQVIQDSSPVREQDRHTIIVSTINSGAANREAALDFIIENFHLIQPRVQGLSGTTNILNALARTLNTEEHSRRIDVFVERHQSIFTAGEVAAVNAIRENIAAAISWNNEHLSAVDAWLREYYDSDNGSNIVTSSVLVLFSIIIAILNL